MKSLFYMIQQMKSLEVLGHNSSWLALVGSV